MPDAPAKAERRAPPGRPRAGAVERHVGARIRERRVMLGLSQHDIAGLLGVSVQHANSYERGANRVTAGRLHQVAEALGVGVGYFYEGVGQAGVTSGPTPQQRRLLELARDFANLRSRRHQEALCQLARALAGPQAEPGGEAEADEAVPAADRSA